ncbi:Leukotriene A-4 hydrolase [Cryptotermes secundus]|uniref:Leukotriene A(4) hydrolase n=3 Tax=Cryptotermes secundus TaxID=105785 RepID=A0A2J7RI89_9NEOP|nr:leukotriene A-4 hydrolase isoform X2 [Cryptotermes secundus]PNF40549.1 Leukotriene A-4 hydrolase [Cryptotermes secundus]
MAAQGLSPGDPSSFARPDEAEVSSVSLYLDVDFERKVLCGKVDLTVDKKKAEVTHVLLDSKDLNIIKVTGHGSGQVLEFSVGENISTLGSKLEIKLPSTTEMRLMLSILYETDVNSSALQWLPPEQTAGCKHPYLFSQCQAVHCRAMFPCQDTPSVKVTYTAEITAPPELTVLMSARRVGIPTIMPGGLKLHKFEQPVPIPVYLVSIVVGHLESLKIGPRSHVWSEKQYVEKAAYEFAETEQMLLAAESICGEYVWGVYDLLVLPPSFPFGGMENPCLTFVTPTVLAGDRSLADVVAHEISHSWTGNLVTNRNFEHFWLNEGFTVFVERKILAKLYGEKARHFSAIGGLKDLKDAISALGENSPLTCLVPDLRGISPEDAFSTVPYEKGHTLLFHLEELAGGPEVFDPFLKAYITKFKYKSIDTDDFKKFLYEYFPNNSLLKEVDWKEWLFKPGMPPVIPKYDTSLQEVCTGLCIKWMEWDAVAGGPCPFKPDDINNMSSGQVREFLAQLLEENPLSVTKLQTMENTYKLNSMGNSEIYFRWLRLGIKGRWKEQVDRALEFVVAQGRMKFVRPLYRDMYDWEDVRDKAIAVFKSNKSKMMYLTAYTVAKDLHLES